MEQPPKTTVIIIGILLTIVMISPAFIIAFSQQAAQPQESKEFQLSGEYWNQVYVSEYLAEKTFNGSAKVMRAGLGRVVVEVDGKAYEYKCEGAFKCTERFINETQFRYIGGQDNGTESISN